MNLKIIAEQSNFDFVLEYIDEKYGRVIDFKGRKIYDKQLIFSILARGYWNEYSEPIEFTPPIDLSNMTEVNLKRR